MPLTALDQVTPMLSVIDYGLTPYPDMWQIQKDLQKEIMAGRGTDSLLLCEHPPVITIGRSGSRTNLLVSDEILSAKGISLHEIERGGDITYHGPGQIVGYPIINLNNYRRDVGWYMRSLEEVIIETLNHFGIQGVRVAGRTGVWTAIGAHGTNSKHPGKDIVGAKTAEVNAQNVDQVSPAKIASIGVRISRWVTLHGFSLNVRDCSEGFSLINPCGFQGIKISSMDEIANRSLEIDLVKAVLIDNFRKVFR